MNIENSVKTFPTQETDKSTIISNDLTIASLDPSLDHGYRSIQKWDILLKTSVDKMTEEAIEKTTIRLFEKGAKHDVNDYKIEILSDSDPFFHLSAVIDRTGFARYKSSERLTCTFETFKQFLRQLLNNLESENNEKFQGTMKIHKNGMGVFSISEAMEFRSVSVLNLTFVPTNALQIRKSIIFRYNVMKLRYKQIEKKINVLISTLQEKNPILLTYLKKNLNLVPKYD